MQRGPTVFLSLTLTLTLSPLALATDPGTYRPGQPYAATPALSHSLCQAQCQGDAACRGWNFVRANPRQKTGICEFNSRAVSPIQSPISISANQSQIVNSTGQSRIIPAGIRTTRVGTPQTVKRPTAKPAQKANIGARQRPTTPTSKRRIIRQQVPNQVNPQATAYRHSLGTAPQRLTPQAGPRRQIRAPQAAPNIARTTNGLPPRTPSAQPFSRQPQATAPRLQADPRLQQQLNPRRPITRPNQAQSQPQTPVQSQAQAPRRGGLLRALTGQDNQAVRTVQNRAAPIAPPTRPQPQRLQPRLVLSAEEAGQQSLYGHLNDDVAAPKVLKQEDFNIPNDQPIPTVQSVPVKPVNRETFSGLVGG